jgi:hypothetical protein
MFTDNLTRIRPYISRRLITRAFALAHARVRTQIVPSKFGLNPFKK